MSSARDGYEYDIAVSFAGEDRDYVERVVRELQKEGIKVFYDQDIQDQLWGENLIDYLKVVYGGRARYVVLFISRYYLEKKWTNWERQSAQDRGLQQPSPYILPVRLDDSELPGMLTSVAYLDARVSSIKDIVNAAKGKLGSIGVASGSKSGDEVLLSGIDGVESRRPRRKLPVLIVTAVLVLALVVVVLRFGISWAPPDTSQGRPTPVTPSSQLEAHPPLPPPTACAERSTHDWCGKLPGGAAGLAADGTMVILAKNSDNTVARYKQSNFKEHVTLDGNLGGNVGDAPTVVPDARGRLIAFAVDIDGTLRYNSNVESEPPQDNWLPIPGASDMRGRPAAAQDASGRLVVFTRDNGGRLWRTAQSDPSEYKWDSPVLMPGPGLWDDPTVHQDVNRELRVFALTDKSSSVYTWAEDRQRPPSESWSWQQVGGAKLATSPAVVKDDRQRLHLIALGADNSLQHIVEDPIPNKWSTEWSAISPPGLYEDQPAAAWDPKFEIVKAYARRQDLRDKVYSVNASGPEAEQSIATPMDRVLSVAPDIEEALIIYGTHEGAVVTA
ncbi:TIR domain-containing protein [Saccharopolyspora kobensis]|uniref:TIR domain-containing protein n=1 Tax=Saccharopolyspora kobensis TaxID=146035 RepID=A0A1H5V368_9PSEU|nr:TIR domain-containing protein [Saccharopolyspora kobensis]SEF81902.1 TIR domain-containing protein [Saccharopolyspora kobensis]SFC65711.1 TIR domain-containing protein [Saccharopolyspora kobensis]